MLIAYLMCAISGFFLALQPPATAALGERAGATSFSSLVSFLIGLVIIIVYFLIDSDVGRKLDMKSIASSPWWVWFGGAFGAFYIIIITQFTQILGATILVAIIISVQILVSGILDNFGWLDLPVNKMDIWRGIGTALIILGAIVMNKKLILGY